MRMDWPLIGAMAGLGASAALLGTIAVVVLRSGPEEARKGPVAPILLSARRADATATPDLQLLPGTPATTGSATLVPAARPTLAPTGSAAPVPAAERPAEYEL